VDWIHRNAFAIDNFSVEQVVEKPIAVIDEAISENKKNSRNL